MLKKLKNYQVLDLVEAFMKIGQMGVESNKRFSYSLILNDDELASQAKAIMSIAQPSEEYSEYEEKRNSIIGTYAKTDSDGNIILNDNRWVVFRDDDKEDATNAINSLNTEYEDILEQRDKELGDYNEILNEEKEYNISTVSIDDIPDDVGKDMFLLKLLMNMID